MEIEQIKNKICGSNTYILHHPNHREIWLVDIGDVDVVIKWAKKADKVVKGVLITHTHFDHIYGLNELLKSFPAILVFTSDEGKEGLYSDKWNLSKYHDSPFTYKGGNVVVLQDSQTVDLWSDTKLYALKTPGHDWSCLTYEVAGALFTGDSYIPGKKVVATFPKSNRKETVESLKMIFNRSDVKMIFPGHGDVVLL